MRYYETGIKGFKIRETQESDCALILKFIKALAEYEKLANEVVATESVLKEWIFEKRKAEVLIGEENEKPVGFAVFFHNFSTFNGRAGLYIEDVFINEDKRKNGYGKAFFKLLAHIAVERGCARMEWSCLDWNKPSVDFYLKIGSKPMTEWTIYRLSGDTLKKVEKG